MTVRRAEHLKSRWLAAAALCVLLLAAQAAALSTMTPQERSTGEVLGSTGFAYVGGLRTYAAAVIWNSIEPQFHEYFSGVPLKEQTFMVPKMRMVTLLDPSFEDAFYVTSFIVYERIGADEGIAVAREGVEANPQSGILRANLTQLLFIQDKTRNRAEIVEYAKSVVAADSEWATPDEQYEGYAIAMNALKSIGESRLSDPIEAQLETWRGSGVGAGDHDHDGDGKQDH